MKKTRAKAPSSIIQHSLLIFGHKTSISLEDSFWHSLKEIAKDRRMTPADLVEIIDFARRDGNLSSAIRLFVLDHYRKQMPPRKKDGAPSSKTSK